MMFQRSTDSRDSITFHSRDLRDQLVVRALGKASLLFSFLMIFFCGYFPFDFSFAGGFFEDIHSKFDVSKQQFYTAGDVRDNILFFMPLGFSLALLVQGHVAIPMRFGAWGRWIGRVFLALLFGGFVSSIIEIGQCFLGDRDPSLVDVVNNAIGTAIAFAGVGLLGTFFLPLFVGLFHRLGAIVGWKTFAACSVICAVGAILPLRYARGFGDLVRWDPRFLVMVGGTAEPRRPRPWQGNIREILFADRSVDDAEADRLLREPLDVAVPQVFGPNFDRVKAWFDFTRIGPMTDRSGNTPPLDFYPGTIDLEKPGALVRPSPPPATQPSADGLAIDGRIAQLVSDGPAKALNESIRDSSQFTFMSTVATANLWQYGPARIVTLSDERYGNNFNVGQDLFDLAVRLRARVTAKGGQAPQIMVTDVFRDVLPKRILVTYSPWKMRIFVNDAMHKWEVTFTPEAALMWQLYPRPIWKFRMGSVGTAFYRSVYRCMFFAPLGLLLAMTVKLAGLKIRHRVMIIVAGVTGVCVAVEWVGASAGIIGFRPSGAVVCLLSAAIGAALVRFHEDVATTEKQSE